MSWTDERIDVLRSMWLEGQSASQIANALGGVSRNAVIGKARRLGLYPQALVTPVMLGRVADLPLNSRTKRVLARDNITFVGDLVSRTEAELLRLPEFGRATLKDVRSTLEAMDLRLGLWMPAWPPDNIEEVLNQIEAARRVAELRQARGGATFVPADDYFIMATQGDESDEAAAIKPMTQQMQSAVLQKASSFANIAIRLDNQPGWTGIGRAAEGLTQLLDRRPEDIPEVLGFLYPVALELGSFIELDDRISKGTDSYAAPLDPEVRRPLSDLVRSLAPWLRAFPSVREADDEASKFLVEVAALKPAFDVVSAAGDHTLLNRADLDIFQQLHDSAHRGEFQGAKAGGRAKLSASNFVIGVVAFAGSVYGGALGSQLATSSPLVQKAANFLTRTEESIVTLMEDMPHDLQYSISEFIKKLRGTPATRPEPPKEVDIKPPIK